jgi:hypothetical protein
VRRIIKKSSQLQPSSCSTNQPLSRWQGILQSDMLGPFQMQPLIFTLALFTALASAQSTHPTPAQHPPAPKKTGQDPIVYWNMSRSSVNFLLRHVPQTNLIRLAQLKLIFHDLQCNGPNLREQTFPGGKNLLCTLPAGLSADRTSSQPPRHPGIILFIADYKHEGSGQSAIDNWTGALMLPFIFHALTVAPRRHTFLFAGVEGDAGAKALFDSITSQQVQNTLGVVALDCLGLGSLRYYVNPYDSFNGTQSNWLTHQIQQAALDQHIPAPISALPGGWFKVDVTREFRHHNIQSVLLFSVDFKQRKLPGSQQDTYASLNPDAYYQNLICLAVYAVELDKPWPSDSNKNGAQSTFHSLH